MLGRQLIWLSTLIRKYFVTLGYGKISKTKWKIGDL